MNPQILITAEYMAKPLSLPEARPFINVETEQFTLNDGLLMRHTKANWVHQHIEGGQ